MQLRDLYNRVHGTLLFSSRRRHTRCLSDWSSDVCSSDLIVLLPGVFACLLDFLRNPPEVLWRQHLSASMRCASTHVSQGAFALACLPYEAYYSLDAILRTLWRMLATRRRLLEWSVSSEAGGRRENSLAEAWRTMGTGPVLALAALFYLMAARPSALLVTWPIWGLWAISPSIAWWISRPVPPRASRLTAQQSVFLRKLARKTWDFFETFAGPEDNWLPPDNYQEHPVARIAH